MTRINVVPPQELTVKHLVAEYKEITRLPNNLKKSLSRKGKPFQMTEIPSQYTLGKGHVKFFYDKMAFLQNRFESLVKEMLNRGYSPKYTDSSIFVPDNKMFYNGYQPTDEAIRLNRERIQERLSK
jgi:deoxyribonuclease (pyrimidine dimer)